MRLVRGEVQRLAGLQDDVIEDEGTEHADIARVLQKIALSACFRNTGFVESEASVVTTRT